jgi:phosphoribosylamine--glycine ligase
MNYRGYIDVATIIDKQGTPRPLEFTARPGWPCFVIQSALHRGDPAQWMADALEGRDTLEYVDEIAVGVVIGYGDFPYGQIPRKDLTGFPITCPEEEVRENVHLCDAKMGDAPHTEDGQTVYGPTRVTCGDYVAVCTGTDYTVAAAARRAYRSVKKLEITGSPHWRNDIGKRLEHELPEVQEHGYCEDGWEYQ